VLLAGEFGDYRGRVIFVFEKLKKSFFLKKIS